MTLHIKFERKNVLILKNVVNEPTLCLRGRFLKLSYFIIKNLYFKFLINVYFKILSVNFHIIIIISFFNKVCGDLSLQTCKCFSA